MKTLSDIRKPTGLDVKVYKPKTVVSGSTIFKKLREQSEEDEAKLVEDLVKGVATEETKETETTKIIRKEETIIDTLKNICEEQESAKVTIGNDSLFVKFENAKTMLTVYEALNDENKNKMEKMLNEDINTFSELMIFSLSQVRG